MATTESRRTEDTTARTSSRFGTNSAGKESIRRQTTGVCRTLESSVQMKSAMASVQMMTQRSPERTRSPIRSRSRPRFIRAPRKSR